MENGFYFSLKALFVLKIFNFFVKVFCFFKVYDVTTSMHIMTSISRSKGNQAMKLGQLVKYNMRNIFLEKSYRKYGGEKLPDPFLKTQN